MNARDLPRKPRIAVSACLIGQEVRFNGGHKASRLCNEVLSEHFDLVPVCPEVAIGLGVPRAPIRLVGDPADPQAVCSRDPGLDLSGPLRAYGQQMAKDLDDICGYIFMHKSPSCGLERVKVYQANGYPATEGGRGCSPPPSVSSVPIYRWKKMAGSVIRCCARTSSPGYMPTPTGSS